MIKIICTNWKPRPEGGNSTRQRFAIGDVHGHADLLEALLDHIDTIEPGSRPRDIVFTGDLVDRGPEPLRAIRLAMEAEARCDRRVILPGNHEGYMLEALDDPMSSLRWWSHAGGRSVCKDALDPADMKDLEVILGNEHSVDLTDIPKEAGVVTRELTDLVRKALPDGFVEMMRKSSGHLREDDLIFVHAGIAPIEDRERILASDLMLGAREWGRWHWSLIRNDFIAERRGWDVDAQGRPVAGETIVIHGHTIENGAQIADPSDLAAASDKVDTHRRINIDAGSYKYRNLACVEFDGPLYRLHAAVEVA